MDAPPGFVPIHAPNGRVVRWLAADVLVPPTPPTLLVIPTVLAVLAVRTGRRRFIVIA